MKKKSTNTHPSRTRLTRKVVGPVDLPRWAGSVGLVTNTVPLVPSSRVHRAQELALLIMPAVEDLVQRWTSRAGPPMDREAAHRLATLAGRVLRTELERHPDHPRGQSCALTRGRGSEPDSKDVEILALYLRGRSRIKIIDDMRLDIGSDQGLTDALLRPVRLAVRRAYWRGAERVM